MNRKFKDTLLIGAALFAMFFGAGNLIFPPSIGIASGDQWLMSLLGFIITGIGLPVLGIIAVAKAGGTINDLASKVHPMFSKILGAIIVLAIGPLLAIPRTGATVFEIGIKPIFGNVSPAIVSIIYFSITLFFVIKPSGIMDKIGKILTPILLIVTLSIVAKGIINPIGTTISTGIKLPFTNGFTSGYQTMDALGSIVMAAIVLVALIEKGYKDKKEQIKMTMMAGIIAGAGLLVIYGGLLYLGACSSGLYSSDIAKSELIVNITNLVLGNMGQISMCIVVSAACLTTSIGLTAVVGNYFSQLSNNKISYRFIVIFTTLFSAVMAVAGVEQIVKLAVPLLVLVYPTAMVLIVLGLFDQFIPNKNVYRGAVLGASIVGIFDGLSAMNIEINSVHYIISKLPLASAGFGWVLPALLLGLIGNLIPRKINHEDREMLKTSEQY